MKIDRKRDFCDVENLGKTGHLRKENVYIPVIVIHMFISSVYVSVLKIIEIFPVLILYCLIDFTRETKGRFPSCTFFFNYSIIDK